MKTYRLVSRSSFIAISPPSAAPASAGSEKNSRTRAFTISPPRVSSVLADDFVFQIELQLSVLHQVQQETR